MNNLIKQSVKESIRNLIQESISYDNDMIKHILIDCLSSQNKKIYFDINVLDSDLDDNGYFFNGTAHEETDGIVYKTSTHEFCFILSFEYDYSGRIWYDKGTYDTPSDSGSEISDVSLASNIKVEYYGEPMSEKIDYVMSGGFELSYTDSKYIFDNFFEYNY